MPITIDQAYLADTLRQLVQINSINPLLSSDGVGEAEIGTALAEHMTRLGLETRIYELAPGRVNVVGLRRGTGSGPSLMWNAHSDTVGRNGMPEPFQADIRAGRLYGRGSQDMKGSLAAMLAAVQAMNRAGLRLAGDLLLAAVADEEYASLGTEQLLRQVRADAAVVTEPTDLKLALAHRGFAIFNVETTGRAAHGSRYQDGIDAILHMGRFLAGLDGLEKELRQRPPHTLVGPPSIHASTIHGGTETSTYPAACLLELERRTVPGESQANVQAELQAIIDRLAAADLQFRAALRPVLSREPLETPADSRIARASAAALAQVTGRPAEIAGAAFWTDAALLAEAGIPAVVFGPHGQGLHSAEEWVDLESCASLAAALVATAGNFCGLA